MVLNKTVNEYVPVFGIDGFHQKIGFETIACWGKSFTCNQLQLRVD